MTKRIFGTFMLAGLTMVGCAGEYVPLGYDGGYWDTPLASNRFRVGFRGNEFTSPEHAYSYALRHAAEVTISAGFKYFIILDAKKTIKSYQVQTEGYDETHGDASGHAIQIYKPGNTFTEHAPRATFVIALSDEKPNGNSFDAEDVLNSSSRESP